MSKVFGKVLYQLTDIFRKKKFHVNDTALEKITMRDAHFREWLANVKNN